MADLTNKIVLTTFPTGSGVDSVNGHVGEVTTGQLGVDKTYIEGLIADTLAEKLEQDDLDTALADYLKSEDAFDGKYSSLTGTENVANKSDITTALESYYDKNAIDQKLTSGMTYKGSVDTKAALDALTATAKVGDFYNVSADGKNYAFDGSGWDDLSGIMDVSDLASKEELTNATKDLASKTDVANATKDLATSETVTALTSKVETLEKEKIERVSLDIQIPADSWKGSAVPYTTEVTVAGLDDTAYFVIAGMDEDAISEDERAEYERCVVRGNGKPTAGKFPLKAIKAKPAKALTFSVYFEKPATAE